VAPAPVTWVVTPATVTWPVWLRLLTNLTESPTDTSTEGGLGPSSVNVTVTVLPLGRPAAPTASPAKTIATEAPTSKAASAPARCVPARLRGPRPVPSMTHSHQPSPRQPARKLAHSWVTMP